MGPDLDSLVTRLYVTVDDLLATPIGRRGAPRWGSLRSDAEMVTLAVIQVLLRFDRFLRHAHAHLKPWFPYLPARSGYNKRLRRSAGFLYDPVVLREKLLTLNDHAEPLGLDPIPLHKLEGIMGDHAAAVLGW